MDLAMLIMQAVFLGSLPIILLLAKFFISKYLEEKARNLATKEDVEEITQKIEEVKAEVDLQKNIRETKYRLKYDACLRALALVDAVLSHKIAPPAVIVACPSNIDQTLSDQIGLNVRGYQIRLNDLWGRKEELENLLDSMDAVRQSRTQRSSS